MKQLSKTENMLFRIGALLMLAGAATWLFAGWWATAMFVIGVILFATMQLRATYEGSNFVVQRLRRQQLFGAAMLVLSAIAMIAQQASFYLVRHNEWVVLLLIGAVIQFYTAIRIPQALKAFAMLIIPFVGFVSCSDQYLVDGTTTVHGMEGKMLYLKVYDNNDLRNIDSAYVTHGKFAFKGSMDTTTMANLFIGNQSLMPVVLEGGDIVLTIDDIRQNVSGSPLNDSLYAFIQRKTQIDNQLAELPRKEGRMVMDGMEHEEIIRQLANEEIILNRQADQLITSFIKNNYTNVLGPGVFMIMTSEYAYPVLTPQIEELILGAPNYFLNHPYVKEYLRVANENMEKMRN